MPDADEREKMRILRKNKKLKHKEFGSVRISSDFDGVPYEILLMTYDCADKAYLMELIGRWRKENERWFLSQFPVSVERTTKWFKEKVIDAPDRLLFVIKVHKDYIGHVGLFRFDFENKTCEIDNIVRGEASYPGIMGDAVRKMMEWGEKTLDLKGYSLKVLSNNERAIRLYDRLGFREVGRIPLVYVEGKDGRELVEAPNANKGKADNYYILMKSSSNFEGR